METIDVLVGRIGKPHGLLGEVTVQLHTDEPERRLAVGTVIDTEATAGTGVPRALTVRSTRVHNGVWLVAFEEIPDRTGAESLRGTRLVVDAADVLPADDEDDVFTEEQLRGLAVVDPAGTVLGSAFVTALVGMSAVALAISPEQPWSTFASASSHTSVWSGATRTSAPRPSTVSQTSP